ncbi:phage portal protein [Cypionkella sp.]|uniref:phage portal protein n=1 Tax=Cypionkella sp. TaxID=2811411 RepID=UPI002ABA5708|nr:phage portal protein [Cypionkella sp.]MDZ4394776.1 phage portal protein [Cypionkella sp.]
MFDWFRKKPAQETRATGGGYTHDLLMHRAAFIAGKTGAADLTACVQTCVGLWESGLSIADVDGADLLDVASLGLAGRALALRGEAVFLIRDRLVPVSDWSLTTRDGRPRAYQCSIPEAGGGRTETALAAEVLHFRIGTDVAAPWQGTSPLRRSSLTADMLGAVEGALNEVYQNAPIGSQVVPFPEASGTDLNELGASFRAKRGRTMLRESVQVSAAGGPAPAQDWKPQNVTPDIQGVMPTASLEAARASICGVYGVLPALLDSATTGPLVREAQRHLAQWALMPVAALMAQECAEKLGGPVTMDVMRPLQAFDAGGRARALGGIIEALAIAKEAGVDPTVAMQLVNFAPQSD